MDEGRIGVVILCSGVLVLIGGLLGFFFVYVGHNS